MYNQLDIGQREEEMIQHKQKERGLIWIPHRKAGDQVLQKGRDPPTYIHVILRPRRPTDTLYSSQKTSGYILLYIIETLVEIIRSEILAYLNSTPHARRKPIQV